MSGSRHQDEAGFTLIEMIIALSLFALVSMAGVALVDAVVRVEERTAGRLDRLAQIQRAMFLLSRDLEQASRGSLGAVDGGVRFTRNSASVYEPAIPVVYAVRDGGLYRLVDSQSAGHSQLVLAGVSSARWTFLSAGKGWSDEIQPSGTRSGQPMAVAVDMLIDQGESGASRSLRRIVELPAPAAEITPNFLATLREVQAP